MNYPESETLKDKLVRQGLHEARLQSDRANGLASAPTGGEEDCQRRHSPMAQQVEGTPRAPMGMEKTGGRNLRQVSQGGESVNSRNPAKGNPFLVVVADNVATATDKPTGRKTNRVSLSVIEGGR